MSPSTPSPPSRPTSTDPKTPLPVVASWYADSEDKIEQATRQIEQATVRIEQAASNLESSSNKVEQTKTNNMTISSTSSNVNKSEKSDVKRKDDLTKCVASSTTTKYVEKSSSKDISSNKGKVTEKVSSNTDVNYVNKEEASTMIEQAKKYSDEIIASVSKDETEQGICGDDTKQKLNEMFDELVNEQNTMEIIESSEQYDTVRRRQAQQIQKTNVNDETDNKSVKSDTTMIENFESKVDSVSQDSSSLLNVPQSPKEIRKMFQQPAVFQKSFSRVAEVELPAEMQAGMRGKVRQSRETFLRQASADLEPKSEATEKRPEVPPSPRQTRRKFEHSSSAEATKIRSEELRVAKMEELEAVRASRAATEHEAFLAQEVTSAGSREKEEREREMMMLSSRRQELQEEMVQMEDKEQQLKEERAMELAELSGRTMETAPREEPAGRDRRVRGERAAELEAVATRKVERVDWSAGDERAAMLREERMRELEQLSQRKLELPVQEGDSKEQELRAERARELAELARRPGGASPQLTAASEQLDEVTEELRQIAEMDNVRVRTPEMSEADMRSRVRSTAASWKERAESANRENQAEVKATPKPTGKIGNMFKRDSDYWKLSDSTESLPLPAPELTEPPPPPRQSSRGKMDEYRAPWRKN